MTAKNMNLYIDLNRLPQYAENVARTVLPVGDVDAKKTAVRLSRILNKLKDICLFSEKYARIAIKLPTEVEWLIDNRYMAEREAKESIADLKRAKKLPMAGDGTKHPVIYLAAYALVHSGKGEVSSERLRCFLKSFQNVQALTEKELSLFIPMVKLALISMLYDTGREISAMLACKLKKDESNPFIAEELVEKLKSAGECISCEFAEKASEAKVRHEEMTVATATVFSSLRLLAALDISEILEEVSHVEQTLMKDPAGVYGFMEQESRSMYRREIARLADKSGLSEHVAAEKILKLSQQGEGKSAHVGNYIYENPLGKGKKKKSGIGYIGSIVLISFFVSVLTAYMIDRPLFFLLLLLPVFEIVKNTVDFLVLKFTRPKHLPRMELKSGIPTEGRTLCIVSTLLISKDSGRALAKLLEEYKLANRASGGELIFGILADFKESTDAEHETDKNFLQAAEEAFGAINKKYGGGFYLFSRKRSYNAQDKRYMAWERKRGAILDLVRLLKGEESRITVGSGNLLGLKGVKYIILLDSDTRLGVDTARELVGAMLHPLNAPQVNVKKGIVTAGHGILQPRIALDLGAANRSDFARIFAGQGGIDPYSTNSGDVYQDLYNEGSFTGKGILSVDAYHACLNHRLPENTILSHDLLEGAYLRSGYMGDAELTDGFPYKVSSYYERMHRWIRGDWQTSPWQFRKVRNEELTREKNPINSLNKWKIFDNLRRSLTPIVLFAAIILCVFFGGIGFVVSAVSALVALCSRLMLSSVDSMLRPGGALRPKYKSSVIAGFSGGLMQTFLQFMLLPYTAFVSLSAVLTALYRMFVSKKNMLAWITADDADKRKGDNLSFYYRKMFSVLIIGVAAIVFSPYAVGITVGILWVLAPACASILSRKIEEQVRVSEEDRNYLTRCAGDIWRYFDKMLNPKRSYLPPDNWQEEPATGTAERTSPTNIGLAMLSALAACDLHLCAREKALGVIQNMLATVERLQKWNGHLYNWYDIRTLKPLEPRYISTVDSGNLVGCIIALIEGLKEQGAPELVSRLQRLIDAMSFLPLYDGVRKLFYIGFDAVENAPTKGWYDLMASEARQTSYIAIARGEVDKKHWQKLGRVLACVDGHSGMASWTGTMFEYFMPNLLMPWYKNSLIFESLKLCLYTHKKKSTPWGISESSFYAFDTTLNYKYKAHGVQGLALKRGMERETVVSPYSTFLALPFDLKGAVKNLKRLKKLGMEGRFGYYEAADFTSARVGTKDMQIVKCFMVHHMGMSLMAIDNALNGGIMQLRFMSDPAMSGHAQLLQEKGPVGQIIATRQGADVPEKPDRMPTEIWKKQMPGVDIQNPSCTLLSNGAYTVFLTELGSSYSAWEDMRITRFDANRFRGADGMSFFLKSGTDLVSLLPAPEYDSKSSYYSEFTGEHGRLYSRFKDIEACMEIFVPQGEIGEHRDVAVHNTSNETRDFELFCYFEPVLSSDRDFMAHPAFSKLSIETAVNDCGIMIKRRSGVRVKTAALCFACSEKMEFDTSKEAALGRGGQRAMAIAAGQKAGGSIGAVLDPCMLARVKFTLKEGESKRVHYALAVSADEEAAAAGAQRILKLRRLRGLSHLDSKAKALEMSPAEVDDAMSRLGSFVYFTGEREKLAQYIEAGCQGRQGLWRYGISGDYPVFSVIIASEDEAEKGIRLIKEHALIAQNGFKYDLVFVINDGGSYHQPVRTLLGDALRTLGRESYVNTAGGIHLIDGNTAEISGVLSMSGAVLSLSEGDSKSLRNTEQLSVRKYLINKNANNKETPKYHFDNEQSFVFDTSGGLDAPTWSHILTNGSYGFQCTDAGTGNMWYRNAREFRINTWQNDPLSDTGTETIELVRAGKSISLFAACDDLPCNVTYGFGFASWEKSIGTTQIKTTAFIHPKSDARIIIIDIENRQDSDKIKYFTELILGPEEADSKSVITALKNDAFIAKNMNNEGEKSTYKAMTNVKMNDFTCDKTSFYSNKFDNKIGAGLDPCFGVIYDVEDTVVLVCGVEDIDRLRELTSPEKARIALEETKEYWRQLVCGLYIHSPSEELNAYMNGWALYQVLACRVMGRTSIYQSGGAYGFRDQLQDVCALTECVPELVREQIFMACRHQYEEGDVQHWWHQGRSEEFDRGVRTRCSDDLLWLPYTACEFYDKTGDTAFFNTPVDYLRSHVLREGEHDRYETAEKAGNPETVFLHCIKALEMVLHRGTGEHGLLLIGGGDWNDGFDKVGIEGRGESVWLTWFAAYNLNMFANICDEMGEKASADRYRREAEKLGLAAENAWDGKWYLRGYYDNGMPLGSDENNECKIDSIAQSFAVISGCGSDERVKIALKSALERLYDRENGIVKLFAPPFDGQGADPGYIMGYLPGIRENGGQYTHAAIWLASACLKAGLVSEGRDILIALLPLSHPQDAYKTEPFVLTADVYSNPQHMGRGGWSWYTGAAAWYYRTVMEELLGLKQVKGEILLTPRLPQDWKEVSAVINTNSGKMRMNATRGGKHRILIGRHSV